MIRAIRNWKKRNRMLHFYKKLIPPGGLCFDIGANHGSYSELFLKMGARVIAVEPQKTCFDQLNKKFVNTKQIQLVKAVLGEKNGAANLFIGNNDEISTLSNDFMKAYGVYEYNKWLREETVEMITLDGLILKYGVPDFCKIDVEGYEMEVISGLSRKMSLISLEYNYLLRHKAIDCVIALKELGFQSFNFSRYENCQFENENWMNEENFVVYIKNLAPEILHGDVFARSF